MDKGFQQVKTLLHFIVEDRVLQALTREATRYNLSLQIVRKLKRNEITLKQVEHMKTDIFDVVIDVLEDVRGSIEHAKALEARLKKQERKVSSIAHELIDCTVTQMVYKLKRGRQEDVSPVETIFMYDNMGPLGQRLRKYQCCSLIIENDAFERIKSIKQTCHL